jgi:3-phosphoshikimate 1-carboxyvinyltransferase
MSPLLKALQELGCEVEYHEKEGHFPFTLKSHGFSKTTIKVNIDISSQFLSGLLMVAPLANQPFEIQVEGTHGLSYVEMTRQMMKQFGVKTNELVKTNQNHKTYNKNPIANSITVEENQSYTPRNYQIEPDVSSACYFYALAPLLGVTTTVKNISPDSMQGDINFLKILEQMACTRTQSPQGITLSGTNGTYQGLTADLSACSDQAITLAALAPFATTPTTITGIAHIRHQESNRIRGIIAELSKMGIQCEETQDGITIHPAPPKPSLVETYDDHRMAMGFSLIGLRTKGVVIDNPLCCKKTFENFFDVLENIVEKLR